MTETARTVTYIGVAVVLLVVAGFVNRKPAPVTEDSLVGEPLLTSLKSPQDVAGLEIVTAGDAGNTDEFRVVRGASGWTLPLHNNYPADAEKEVAAAAASLIDLKVLSVVSTQPSEHAEYGVVDPEKASPGAEGVGKLVKVLDKSGNNLVRLVVGKQDKQAGDAMDSQQELRFVRVLPQDAVYRVAMPPAKFSTSFADWIETDLLKLDPWDITNVTLKDYTFDVARDPLGRVIKQAYEQLSTMELAFNDKDSKWSLNKLVKFENHKPHPVEMAADEELNSTRLNEMKTALDDLKIVDVRPKPAGMTANLKANKKILDDGEAVGSLMEVGFYPVETVEGQEPEILSSDGEVLVTMKDGVEYTLRFGDVAGIGKKEDADAAKGNEKEKTKGKAKEEDKPGTTLNRFIMVSARFNKDLIPKPALEAVPGATATSKPDDKSAQDKDQPQADSAKGPEPKTEKNETDTKPETKSKDAAKVNGDASKSKDTKAPEPDDGDKSASQDAPDSLQFVKFQDDSSDSKKQPASDADKSGKSVDAKSSAAKAPAPKEDENTKSAADKSAKDDDAAKSAETKDAGDAKGDENKENAKAPGYTKSGAGEAKTGQSKSDEEKAALDRKRIEKENEQKQKEYDDKIKKGEDKAAELNARFAGWYYVVSEATYLKIHLNRDDVIKKKTDAKKTDAGAADNAGETGAGVDALKIPPLKIDPFQDRGEETKGGAKADGKKVEATNIDAKKDESNKNEENKGEEQKDQ
jgi:hypothetical protein